MPLTLVPDQSQGDPVPSSVDLGGVQAAPARPVAPKSVRVPSTSPPSPARTDDGPLIIQDDERVFSGQRRSRPSPITPRLTAPARDFGQTGSLASDGEDAGDPSPRVEHQMVSRETRRVSSRMLTRALLFGREKEQSGRSSAVDHARGPQDIKEEEEDSTSDMDDEDQFIPVRSPHGIEKSQSF